VSPVPLLPARPANASYACSMVAASIPLQVTSSRRSLRVALLAVICITCDASTLAEAEAIDQSQSPVSGVRSPVSKAFFLTPDSGHRTPDGSNTSSVSR
jgi:hypothetical protein